MKNKIKAKYLYIAGIISVIGSITSQDILVISWGVWMLIAIYSNLE